MSVVPLDFRQRTALTRIEKLRQDHVLSNAAARDLVWAIAPQETPASSPPSARATFMQAIAAVQKAQPQLSFAKASDAVQQQYPELYHGYLHESRHPHLKGIPLKKQADADAPTEAQVREHIAKACADQPGLTKDEAWTQLLKTVPEGSPAFQRLWRHYARYQVSDEAVRARDAAADARR